MPIELTAANRETQWRLRVENVVNEALADASTVLLSSSDATYGIRRLDTGASVIADGTAFTKLSGGKYEYKFNPPVMGIHYEAAIEITQPNGDVDRESITWFARGPIGTDDPYLFSDDDLKVGIPWIDDLVHLAAKQADFSKQRLDARRYLDQLIVERAGRNRRTYVREVLDRGELMLTDSVARHNRLFVLAEILHSQIGEPGDKYDRMSQRFRRDAEILARNMVCELDTNGDGFPELYVDLGRVVGGLA